MTASDDEIIALITRSSPEGIEALYDQYGGLAYTVALRVLNDQTAAEDVVQEAFLSVWRRANSFQPGRGSLRAWLCTIVRNRAIDRLRGNRSHARFDLPLDETPIPGGDDPWAEVSQRLSSQNVHRALEDLPVEQRQTLELAYWSGYSQTEIATAMSVPLGTVKGRVRLALDRLRTALEPTEAPWPTH